MAQYQIPALLEKAFINDFTFKADFGVTFNFYTVDMGLLKVRDGNIIACDPFVYDGGIAFDTRFPTGEFPVELAVARFSDDERVGFARIKFAAQEPATWTMAIYPGQDVSTLKADEIFGYGVDSGTGGFMDATGFAALSAFMDEDEDNFEVLTDEMDKTYQHTRSWLLWEKDGANVAMFSSGVGDGFYATYIGRDANGAICRLVTSFGLV